MTYSFTDFVQSRFSPQPFLQVYEVFSEKNLYKRPHVGCLLSARQLHLTIAGATVFNKH